VKGPPSDPSVDWIVCGACSLHICFKCGDERHDPAQCGKEAHELLSSRRSYMKEAQLAFDTWQQNKSDEVKPCPNCKGFIEKNRGCNHMTCKNCKHQFCWLCMSKYVSGHYSSPSFPDCNGKQYWSPPPPVDPELQKKYRWIYFPPNYQYADVDLAQAEQTKNVEKMKRAKKIGVYVGMGVAVATLGIPAAIIGGPIYGVYQLHKRLKLKRRRQSTMSLI